MAVLWPSFGPCSYLTNMGLNIGAYFWCPTCHKSRTRSWWGAYNPPLILLVAGDLAREEEEAMKIPLDDCPQVSGDATDVHSRFSHKPLHGFTCAYNPSGPSLRWCFFSFNKILIRLTDLSFSGMFRQIRILTLLENSQLVPFSDPCYVHSVHNFWVFLIQISPKQLCTVCECHHRL